MFARVFGGRAYRRFYRLFFSVTGALTAFPLLILVILLPDQTIYIIPAPWAYGTLLVQGLAAAILVVGVLQTGALSFVGLRQALSGDTVVQTHEKLVTGGLYRWVRHPLYTASLLFIWLVPVMTWNILAVNLGLTTYLLVGSVFEERKLAQQFGKDYEEYRSRTPRIVPGIRWL
jgi:protein-S-isoprenylcysteine O-methyltransferase Ste14